MTTSDLPAASGRAEGDLPDHGAAPDLLVSFASDFDDAFDELARTAYRVAYRILGDREDARDVVQESLARAYARWSKVQVAAPAWVSRVAANLALDLVRRRARRPGPEMAPTFVDATQALADRMELVAALRRLSKRQREVVVLRYVADISEADVAQLLGCSTGTVKRHAHRGLEALRSSLRPGRLADLPAGPTDLPAGPTDLPAGPTDLEVVP